MASPAEILAVSKDLSDEGLKELLETKDEALAEELRSLARAKADEVFGREVYLRGLIEWTNNCRNDCYYCGIRKSNNRIARYTLTRETILKCCADIYKAGVRTVVLQGGEYPLGAELLTTVVADIRAAWPSMAITVSMGELPFHTYERYRRSGADRYLLRHETADPEHFAKLHPAPKSIESRIRCLGELRSLGFQVGMGMMVGTPEQGTEQLIKDIRLMQAFRPEMIGIGPFIPHKDTPFGDRPAGSAETTLRLYSIMRLMLPDALIPSTTAIAALMPGGRIAGIEAGCNVIMPNFTPSVQRSAYTLYEGKTQTEPAAALDAIKQELAAHGYFTGKNRGDHNKHVNNV